MKTVVPDSAYIHLTKEEVLAALEAYDALFDDEDDDWDDDENADENLDAADETDEPDAEDEDEAEDPIVREVERLIAAYAAYFDAYCREHGEVPEDALLYKPSTAIEQVAFQIFTEALHDSIMDEDDD